MFGPQSGKHGWGGLPFVFERVRLNNARRCEEFLKWWSNQGCRMVDMTCELHDEVAAGSQFVTHFTGRVLERLALSNTPINTKAPRRSFNWVAVKELKLSYYIGETLLFSIYTHYGNLI
ncbi:TYRAAT2 [Symbiodinium pilosum]|uniref:TYRAAT2 protein n=1 Tax=Symbiodinium pilosum TaxID=2952 RepID=A0A812XD43_SYMPI|nr:TYRAAT2 [Symbiodinium pilosum]